MILYNQADTFMNLLASVTAARLLEAWVKRPRQSAATSPGTSSPLTTSAVRPNFQWNPMEDVEIRLGRQLSARSSEVLR